MVAPDTSLSPPLSFFLFFFFFFPQTSPSPFSLGWLPWPSSPIAAPPPLGAAGRPRRRLPAPGLREAKARRLPARAPAVSPAPPGAGAAALPDATASRGLLECPGDPLGGRFLSRPPPELAMVAARAPAL